MNKQTQKELLEIVKKNYQEIAEHYSETRKKELWPELKKLASLVKTGDKILDVGCGSGKLLKALADKDIKYIGTDNCGELIQEAKKNYPQHKFQKSDILELSNLPEINFDYVFCVAVLHHLPGKNLRIQALKQLKNKVKNNGHIIITTWNLWDQKKYQKLIKKFFILKLLGKNKMDFGDIVFDWKNPQGEIVSKRYYHAFIKKELKKIARVADLKIERLYKDKYNYCLILKK